MTKPVHHPMEDNPPGVYDPGDGGDRVAFPTYYSGRLGKLFTAMWDYRPVAALFCAVFLLLRFYEFLAVRYKAEEVARFVFGGWRYDVPFVLTVCAALFPVYLLLHFVTPRHARRCLTAGFAVLLGFAFILSLYFAETLQPLGSPYFGFAWDELTSTLGTWGTVGLGDAVAFAVFLGAFLWGASRIVRYNVGKYSTPGVVISFYLILFIACFLRQSPNPAMFEHRVDYGMALNKTQRFFALAGRHLVRSRDASPPRPDEFPLMRRIGYEDVLGPLMNATPAGEKPHFVFILVEGLGGDFVGPGGRHKGFTPYLDELAGASLYWPNCLSNTTTPAGTLPSILGSLPYGRGGFLSYATSMPDHQTFLSLLKPNGYTSNFFYPGHANTDGMDIFLEYQGVDSVTAIRRATNPPPDTASQEKVEHELPSTAELSTTARGALGKLGPSPRIDIYLTAVDTGAGTSPTASFEERLSALNPLEATKRVYTTHKPVFTGLLDADQAIRALIEGYSSRPDYGKTVFIITGTHRLGAVPLDHSLSRFHVPLIVHSPLLKRAATFPSLVAHSDVPATLLGWMAAAYGMEFPTEMPFISGPLNTAPTYASRLDVALYRNDILPLVYVDADRVLFDGRLYQVSSRFELSPLRDAESRRRLAQKLEAFSSRSLFACEYNRVDRRRGGAVARFELSPEERVFVRRKVGTIPPDAQLEMAAELAREGNYEDARAVLRNLLNHSPNYTDARITLGRVYAWDKQYDTARQQLKESLRRSPGNPEAYAALSDVEYWDGDLDLSLAVALEGIKSTPDNADLLARQARALWRLEKLDEARAAMQKAIESDPENELAVDMRRKLLQ